MTEKIKDIEIGSKSDFTLIALHIVNQEGMSVDISKLVPNFRIFESIYSKFLTGDVSVVDALNMLKHFRFTGQEYLRIAYRHGEESDNPTPPVIDRTFRVYQVINITRLKETTQAYQLKICDPAMFTARTTRLSKVYRGSHSEMLFKVLNEEMELPIKEIQHWEDSEHDNHQFVCPNWTATRFIDFISTHANKGTNSLYRNGFFFYQTALGGFCFKSIDNMISGNKEGVDDSKSNAGEYTDLYTGAEFTMKPNSGAKDKPTREKITSITRPQLFDTLQGTYGGAYSSGMEGYDPIRKIGFQETYDIEETFDRNQNHVSKVPLIRTERMLEQSSGQERGLTTEDSSTDGQAEVDAPTVKDVPYHFQLPPNKQFKSTVVYDYYSKHDFDNSDKYDTDDVFKGQNIKDNSKLERRGMLAILQQHSVKITIPIRSDLTVGQIVKLNIPEPEILDEGADTEDKINDNRYLITDLAIHADPLGGEGVLDLECVKESYAKDITLDNIQRMNKAGSKSVDIDKST